MEEKGWAEKKFCPIYKGNKTDCDFCNQHGWVLVMAKKNLKISIRKEWIMKFKEYQNKARQTAIYGAAGLEYTILGLVSEAGEVADVIKRRMRENRNSCFRLTKEDQDKLANELGDVLWYVANCCCELGFDMDNVARMNLGKLAMRAELGKLTER